MKLRTPQHAQDARQAAEAPAVDLGARQAAHALPDAFRAQAQTPSGAALDTFMSTGSSPTGLRPYDHPVVDLGIDMPHRVGDTVSPDDLILDVREQHHTPEDFEEGDLEDRIYRYPIYRLESIPLAKVELGEWDVWENLVADYAKRIGDGEVPPIPILGHDLGIIDGTHRLNAMAQAGCSETLCWVGVKEIPAKCLRTFENGVLGVDLVVEANLGDSLAMDWKDTFYAESGLDPDVLAFIEGHPFQEYGLGCQDESQRWAREIKKQFPDATVEVVGGMFGFDGEDGEFEQIGHSWVTVDGSIFDPTASQFDPTPGKGNGDYQDHEIEEIEN